MSLNVYKISLAAIFLGVSMHTAEALSDHIPAPPGRPANDINTQIAKKHSAKKELPLSGYLEFHVPAPAPVGQAAFCKKNRSDCFNNMMSQRVHLTWDVLKTIRDVNAAVNEIIEPVTDKDQYGVEEKWTYPDTGKGDCEDFQLLKQKMLQARGFPQSTLRHAVVISTAGEKHDVLVIRTDRGDFVIDNLSDKVRTPLETGYQFLQIQSSKSDYQWQKFNGKDWRLAYMDSHQSLNGNVITSNTNAIGVPLPTRRPKL